MPLDLSNVSVGTADPTEDQEGLLTLINTIQPHAPWDARHLSWQFAKPPSGPARLRVVRSAGRIVALYALIRQNIRVGDTVVPGGMVQDVMTDPAFRGRGFLHHLGSLMFSDLEQNGWIGYTFPNHLSKRSFERTGWSTLLPAPVHTATVQGDGQAIDGVAPIKNELPSIGANVWSAAGLAVGVERNEAFFAWRYGKPGQEYHAFSLRDGAGVLILKVFRGGEHPIVDVLELVVRTGEEAWVERALASCHAFAREQGATKLTAWTQPGHPYHEAYLHAGFTPVSDPDRLVFVRAPTGQVRDAGAWHLTQGDSDVY